MLHTRLWFHNNSIVLEHQVYSADTAHNSGYSIAKQNEFWLRLQVSRSTLSISNVSTNMTQLDSLAFKK